MDIQFCITVNVDVNLQNNRYAAERWYSGRAMWSARIRCCLFTRDLRLNNDLQMLLENSNMLQLTYVCSTSFLAVTILQAPI